MEYIKSGDIYATKRGGHWIVDKESIDSFYNNERFKLLELKRKINI